MRRRAQPHVFLFLDPSLILHLQLLYALLLWAKRGRHRLKTTMLNALDQWTSIRSRQGMGAHPVTPGNHCGHGCLVRPVVTICLSRPPSHFVADVLPLKPLLLCNGLTR
jgi:hypothetical protein